MQEMEHDVLKRILCKVDLRPTNPPDIENMPPGNFESRRMRRRVEILLRSCVTRDNSRELFHQIHVFDQLTQKISSAVTRTESFLRSRCKISPRRIMQFPSRQNVWIPQFDRIDNPVDHVQLAIHDMAWDPFETQSSIPYLRRINHNVPSVVIGMYSCIR